MSFYVDDFITSETIAPFLEESRSAYDVKAVVFLKEHFSETVHHLSHQQLKDYVRLSYQRGNSLGIRSERLHLKYMLRCVFLGSFFIGRSCHRPVLDHYIAASPVPGDGLARFFDASLAYADDWSVYCLDDRACRGDFATSFRLGLDRSSGTQMLRDLVQAAMPRRAAVLRYYDILDNYIGSKESYARQNGLDRQALFSLIYGSVHLGEIFWDDPMFAPFFKTRQPSELEVCLKEYIPPYLKGDG